MATDAMCASCTSRASSSDENSPPILVDSWIKPKFLPSRVRSGAANQPWRAASEFLLIDGHERVPTRPGSPLALSRTGLFNVQASMKISELGCGNPMAGSPSAAEKQVMLLLQAPLASKVVKACRAPMMFLA